MVVALFHQNECLKIIREVVGATLVVAQSHKRLFQFKKWLLIKCSTSFGVTGRPRGSPLLVQHRNEFLKFIIVNLTIASK